MSSVRERHRRELDPGGKVYWCSHDWEDWPCDAIQMADDADRLAAALRPFAVFDVDYPRKQDMRLAIARAALRQHEEATR